MAFDQTLRRVGWLKRFVLAAGISCSIVLGGCESALRGAGKNLVGGGLAEARSFAATRLPRDSMKAMLDSLAAYTGTAIAARLRPPVDTALQILLSRGESAVVRTEDSTIVRVRGSLADALDDVIASKLTLAGLKARYQLDSVLLAAGLRFSSDVSPRLAMGSSAIVDSAAARLTASLSGALLNALLAASDSIAARAANAVSREATKSINNNGIVKTIKHWAPFVGLAVVVLALLFVLRLLRNSQRALGVVTEVIGESGTEKLTDEVRARARVKKIEPWLTEYLKKRGYIRETANTP